MFNFKHILARLLLAASLVAATAPAGANPVYQVSIDTSSLGTGQAFLGLYFMGLAGAGEATATASKLDGAFWGPATLTGSVSGGVPGPLSFSNLNGGGDWFQAIELGGKFSFDLSFVLGAGTTGVTFGWALFDATHYLGVNGDLGNLFLDPDAPIGQQVTMALANTALSSVNVIPEPSTAALMLVAMLGWLAIAARKKISRFGKSGANEISW
jgi:hypothetical protein